MSQGPRPATRGNALADEGGVGVRITFGDSQSAERVYDGSLTVSHGAVVRLVPFRLVKRFLDDDVTVERVPEVSKLNDEATGEQHDYPSLIETRSGTLWAAWQAYKDRGDHIYARYRSGTRWVAAQRITQEKGDFLGTALGEDSSGKVHLIWSERAGRDWNLVERGLDRRA